MEQMVFWGLGLKVSAGVIFLWDFFAKTQHERLATTIYNMKGCSRFSYFHI